MNKVNREFLQSMWADVATGKSLFWADVEWYAVDDCGHLGMFTSGGEGPIPRAVFHDMDRYMALAEWFLNLPPRGGHELLIRYPRVTDWTQAADRGVFAFDFVCDKRSANGYQLVAYPMDPLGIEELPDSVRDGLEAVRVVGARFEESRNFVVDLSHVRSGLVS